MFPRFLTSTTCRNDRPSPRLVSIVDTFRVEAFVWSSGSGSRVSCILEEASCSNVLGSIKGGRVGAARGGLSSQLLVVFG